jgi:tetratricopeptide (TPR) repeat protein
VTARFEPSSAERRAQGSAANQDAAALAESHRRAGRAEEAERVARRGLERDPRSLRLSMALALALLDQRRPDAAYGELVQALAHSAEPAAEVSEQELEDAFAQAEPDAEQVIDADRVAARALREAELGPADEIAPPGGPSVFTTRTMAELLERQGDREGAARIRSRLERPHAQGPATPASDRRRRIVGELERWLANLRMEA